MPGKNKVFLPLSQGQTFSSLLKAAYLFLEESGVFTVPVSMAYGFASLDSREWNEVNFCACAQVVVGPYLHADTSKDSCISFSFSSFLILHLQEAVAGADMQQWTDLTSRASWDTKLLCWHTFSL